jgi:hypothetical protein
MSWVAVGVAAVSVVGGAINANQQKKGAQGAANAQIEAQQQAEAQRRADMMPFMQAGYGALNRQEAVLNGDYSGFMNSPDYKWNFEQGLQGIDRSAAARGAMFSGGADADRMKFASGLASNHLNDYWAKLAGQAGQSYNASSTLAQLGQQSNTISGNARASSYLSRADANGQFATGTMGALGGLYSQYMAQRPQTQPGGGYGASGMYYSAPSTASGANWTNAYGYS